MNLFFIKEMGMMAALRRMHPKEGILSETNLSVAQWVKPTTETFIHSNQFLHYERENTSPCMVELPEDREEVNRFCEQLLSA